MKLSVLLLTTLVTFGSVAPAQAESPIVNGIINGILNTTISSQRRHHSHQRQQPVYHHPHQRHRQVRYRNRRYRQTLPFRHRQSSPDYRYSQHHNRTY